MAKRMRNLRDRTVLITGASSGIGRAIAERAAAQGARIALVARRQEQLEAVAERVRSLGGEAHVAICDVADRRAALACVERVEKILGGVDVAVINAGVGRHRTLVEHDLDDAERLLRVNVLGATRPNAILVPQRAVQQGAKSHFVWVVGKEGKAEQRVVETGQWSGDDWVIDQGLQAGEQVVVDGAIRVAAGAALKVSQYVTPKKDAEATQARPTAAPSESERAFSQKGPKSAPSPARPGS